MKTRWVNLGCVLLFTLIATVGYSRAPQPVPQTARENPANRSGAERYRRTNVAVGYKVVEGWPEGRAPGVDQPVTGVAVDAADNVWVLDRGDIPVKVYRSAGSLVRTWGQGGAFGHPHQVRVDKDGNVWTADNGYNTVTKWTTDGRPLLTLGTKGEAGADDRHFNQPTDVAVAANGDVFVSDGYGNDRVVHFDKNGRFVKSWGTLGSGPGEFSVPHGIALDSKGRLYVADRNNARVQVFEQSGKYVTEWRNIVTPWGIAITPSDEIYVGGSSATQWSESPGSTYNGVPPRDQIVVRFDREGRVHQLWSFRRRERDQPARPGDVGTMHGLAVDRSGDVYLADLGARRAWKFARVPSDVPLAK